MIELKITWLPRPEGQPFYLRLSGSFGGEVEIKLGRTGGRLVQTTVIDVPPLAYLDRDERPMAGAGTTLHAETLGSEFLRTTSS